MSFANPLYLYSTVLNVLLLALSSVSIISPISTALTLPVVVIYCLISGTTVVEEADVVILYLTLERCVGSGASVGAGTFGMELYANLPSV